MENFASSLVSMLIALALVLALAWVSLRLLKRMQYGRANGNTQEAMRFVRALPLGQRERVVVMHYRGEEWVLGVTAGGITLLDKGPVPHERPTSAGG
jgi:flagellar protein FliO/FliZ